MIDERELREMLERRAGTISATPTDAPVAIRRARRRLVLNAAVGTVVGLVVLVGALAGVRAIQTAAPIPADPPDEPRPAAAAAGALAYVLDGDIYVADPDGSNAVKIADGRPDEDCDSAGEYWTEGPMWSPDGRYLAYRQRDCSNPESFGNVLISDAEGNVLAMFPSKGRGWTVAWSPDSTHVAVWDSFMETIGVYGLDGTRQTQLSMPPGWMPSGDNDPMWTPGGTSLMVENTEVPLDGTSRQLPWDADAYSPDGSHVAFKPFGSLSLVVAEADGSNRQVMFEGKVGSLVWSPTGDRIAFISGKGTLTELRLLDVATGRVTSLVESSDYLSVIDVSPQGDRILFSRIDDQGAGKQSLWSINADSSDLRRLIEGTAWGDWLSPSPKL